MSLWIVNLDMCLVYLVFVFSLFYKYLIHIEIFGLALRVIDDNSFRMKERRLSISHVKGVKVSALLHTHTSTPLYIYIYTLLEI